MAGVKSSGTGPPSRLGGEEPACQCRRPRLDPQVGKSPGAGSGTRCSVLAWRIPWAEEPGGLQPMGLPSRRRLSAEFVSTGVVVLQGLEMLRRPQSSLSSSSASLGNRIIFRHNRLPAGVPPQWIQGIRSGDSVGEQNLFIYEYKIRLGRNSVVGKLSGERRLNNLVYVGSQ